MVDFALFFIYGYAFEKYLIKRTYMIYNRKKSYLTYQRERRGDQMTEQERQQQEIERLQKKIKALSKAYHDTKEELEQRKQEEKKPRPKGRPSIGTEKKAQVLALCRQGHSMRSIAGKTDLALSTVHKIITEASQESKRVYVYMDRDKLATIIEACAITHKVHIINFTDDMLSRAFGINENPDWEDFNEFLESRCMPRTRYGIREELRYMGIDVYDPFQIVEKTSGRVHGDGQSLERLNPEWVKKYDEIRKRVKNAEEQKRELKKLFEGNKGGWLSYDFNY